MVASGDAVVIGSGADADAERGVESSWTAGMGGEVDDSDEVETDDSIGDEVGAS